MLNMVGGLMQLLAYGAQDIYFDDKPDYIEDSLQVQKIINRLITVNDRNTECPISYNIFNSNDAYYQCASCKYNFLAKIFDEHVDNNKCPMCKYDWFSQKTKFINI